MYRAVCGHAMENGPAVAGAVQGILSTSSSLPSSFLAADCSPALEALQFAGAYRSPGGGGLGGGGKLLSEVAAVAAPWSGAGTGKRLLGTAGTLFGRASSEDFMYALFFVVHALVLELDVVRYTVNPTWEKGVLGNAREFKKMADCCGDEILAAVSDPETKKAIDLVSE